MHAPVPTPLIQDMAWCWWTRPRATRIETSVYFAALDHGGGMIAARHDLRTGATERARLAAFEDDDHNNPALLAVAGKPLICFYSRHDAEEGMRYRMSVEPLSLAEWHPEQKLDFGGCTTYAQAHPCGSEVHLFTRVDGPRWAWRMSPDWGQTWLPHRDFLAFDTDWLIYMPTALLADGRTLRVAVSGHPREASHKPLHDLWACLVDLQSGAVTLASDGRQIANLRTGENLPLNFTALELVHRTATDRTANLFDVSSGPVFELGYASKLKDDATTRDGWHHVAALRDGQWQVEDIAPTGGKFGYVDAGFYVGSISFPPHARSGQLYLTREQDGLWHFEFWHRHRDGTWSGTDLLPPGPTRLTRPWAVSPPSPELAAVALALERYADDSYYGSLSHLVAAPLPPGFKP
jgi:hypothetical protein